MQDLKYNKCCREGKESAQMLKRRRFDKIVLKHLFVTTFVTSKQHWNRYVVKSFLKSEITCWSMGYRTGLVLERTFINLNSDVIFKGRWMSRHIVQDEKGLQG